MVLITYILQAAFFNQVDIWGVTPNIGLAFIISLGLLSGAFYAGVSGLFYGLVVGLVFSISRVEMFFLAFEYAAVGVLAGFMVDKMNIRPWPRALLFAFMGYILKELINIIPMLILKMNISFGVFVLKSLVGAAMGVLLMVGVYFIMQLVHRLRFMRSPDDDRIFLR